MSSPALPAAVAPLLSGKRAQILGQEKGQGYAYSCSCEFDNDPYLRNMHSFMQHLEMYRSPAAMPRVEM